MIALFAPGLQNSQDILSAGVSLSLTSVDHRVLYFDLSTEQQKFLFGGKSIIANSNPEVIVLKNTLRFQGFFIFAEKLLLCFNNLKTSFFSLWHCCSRFVGTLVKTRAQHTERPKKNPKATNHFRIFSFFLVAYTQIFSHGVTRYFKAYRESV